MVKRTRWIAWSAIGLVVLVLAGGITTYLFLNSAAFRRYATAKIIEQANEATGGRLEVRRVDLAWRDLTAHLYGITLHGSEAAGEKPLLQVDELTIGVKIISVFRRQISLSELAVEHPVVRLTIDKNGKSNIPQPAQKKNSESGPDLFDLAVRHTNLQNGEIYCNDVKAQLNAELQNLQTDIRYEFLTSAYVGRLSYDNGRLQYADLAPYAHRLNLHFTAKASSFSVEPLEVGVASSSATLRATLTNYQAPQVNGSYEVHLHSQDFADLSKSAKLAGDVMLTGDLGYKGAFGNLIQDLRLDGRASSDRLTASSAAGDLDVNKVQARYQLAGGNLQVHEFAADLLDGRLTADATIQHLDETPKAQLRASLQRISITAVKNALRDSELRTLPLTGTLDGGAEADWSGSVRNIRLSSHAEIRGATWAQPKKPDGELIPITGVLKVDYDGSRNVITVNQASLQGAATLITLQGQVSDHSNLQFSVDARDLRQVAQFASLAGGSSSAGNQISGSAVLHGVVRGSTQNPQVSGNLNAQNLQVRGSQWKSLAVAFNADPSQASVQSLTLVSAHQGSAALSARVALNHWAYAAGNPIKAKVAVHQMAVADIQRLAGVHYPVTGNLAADVSLSGSQLNPVGQGSMQIADARAYDEPIQTAALKFSAANGTVNSNATVRLPAGSAKLDLLYTPKTKAYVFHLDAPALVLEKLQTLQAKNMGIAGTVNASASGQGTVDDPNVTAMVQASKLQVQETTLAGIKVGLSVANQRANLTLTSEVAQAHVEAHGSVDLTGARYAELKIDTTRLPLEPFLAVYAPSLPEGFQGETELHANLKGPLQDRARIEAHLTIAALRASYRNLEIESAAPIHADYSHSLVTIQPAEIRGTGTSLHFSGTVPTAGDAAMNVTAKGTLDVRVLQMIRPDIKSSGSIALDVHATGSAKNGGVNGGVHLQDVALSTALTPLGIENLNGDLDLSSDRLQVRNLAGQVGGGQVTAGGYITFRPQMQFNVVVQGQSVRLRYPEGVRTLLDTNLSLSGTAAASTVTGRVLIGSLSFTPDFDMNQFLGQFSGPSAASTGEGIADNMKLQISVQSSSNLNATSSQVSLAGSADLRIIGTAANPVVIGRADLNSGELFFRNNRYQLQRGLITFNNPTQTDPVVDIAVSTTVEQYNLTVTMKGPVDRLMTSYISDPPLSTADVINLIARGQTTTESGAGSTSPDSILAGQVAGQFTGGIQKLTGLSSLQIDPLIGGDNENPSARIALQQRVTKNLLFTFSTDVTQPGAEVIQGEYQINKRWSVSAARDQQGGVSIDGRYHTSF